MENGSPARPCHCQPLEWQHSAPPLAMHLALRRELPIWSRQWRSEGSAKQAATRWHAACGCARSSVRMVATEQLQAGPHRVGATPET